MRKTALDDILPFLKPFRKCRKAPKEDFDHALRQTLMKELGLKMPKSELELIKEPFLRLGYGVNSYFDIMLQIFYLFSFISVVCIPMMYCYSTAPSQGMQEFQKGFKLVLGRFTLGNLGGATVQCQTKRISDLKTSNWDLKCLNAQNAWIKHDEVKYGLMSTEFTEKTYCSDEAIEKENQIIDGVENCSKDFLIKEYIEE